MEEHKIETFDLEIGIKASDRSIMIIKSLGSKISFKSARPSILNVCKCRN